MKATAVAPANIAFIKYWGKKDDLLRLPANGSISMNLDKCLTTTTVEFDKKYKKDSFKMIGGKVSIKECRRVSDYLSRFRMMAKSKLFAKVVSKNSFPRSSGAASSASGFAALSLAASSALGLNLSEKELSILARLGSGSACRSVPSGFVEWLEGDSNNTSYAHSLYPPGYWDLLDILVIFSGEMKKTTTTEGHKASRETSLFYSLRVEKAKELLGKLKKAFIKKDFESAGKIIESDCINMHSVMMTTTPPLFYWSPKTLGLIKKVYEWRDEGIRVYFTIDAGVNIHLICKEKTGREVVKKLEETAGIERIIINKPAVGAQTINQHLF